MAKEEKADQRPGLFRKLVRRLMTGGINPETLRSAEVMPSIV